MNTRRNFLAAASGLAFAALIQIPGNALADGFDASGIKTDPALVARLPDKIKKAGVLTIGSGTSQQVARNIVVQRKHPGRWVTVAVLAVLVLQIGQALVINPNFHWDVFAKYLFSPLVIAGLGWTILLTLATMAVVVVVVGARVPMRGLETPILRHMARHGCETGT